MVKRSRSFHSFLALDKSPSLFIFLNGAILLKKLRSFLVWTIEVSLGPSPASFPFSFLGLREARDLSDDREGEDIGVELLGTGVEYVEVMTKEGGGLKRLSAEERRCWPKEP